MEDKYFETYKKKVYEKLTTIDTNVIPPGWWDSVIKHYYNMGYSEDRTVRAIVETMSK